VGEGRGCEVGEVDEGSVAERSGVRDSMVLLQLAKPDRLGLSDLPFEEVLELIDARRESSEPLTLVFETAAPVDHLYAVEMPAVPALAALAASEARSSEWRPDDADASALLHAALREQHARSEGGGAAADAVGVGVQGKPGTHPCVRWYERETKAFVGDAGSMTCAHVDIAPQLECAHGLHGVKFVGVGTHEETPRLLDEHAAETPGAAMGGSRSEAAKSEEGDSGSDEDDDGWEYGDDDDEEEEGVATSVPTDRPLKLHESCLLNDAAVSIAAVRPGDLLVFSSAALHFATNGAAGLNAALYHGMVTEASLPRLEEAVAMRAGRGGGEEEAAASGGRVPLSAEDVLREIRMG
jgi:hypothetical protein